MADNEKRRKIDHVSHMNLVNECSVGMINYEVMNSPSVVRVI